MFVDSDDWLPKYAVESLIRKQNETKADYICGSVITINPVKNRKIIHEDDCFDVEDNKFNAFLMQTDKRIHASWAKLFNMQIILKYNLRYHEEMKVSEDCMFFYEYMQCCKKIATTSECVYYYNLLNAGSLTHSYYPDRNIYKKAFLVERQKCFKDNMSKDILYANDDITSKTFNTLIGRYVSVLSKKEAIGKIQESYILMKDLLDNIICDDSFHNIYTATKTYFEYEPWLKTGQYDKVYDYFYAKEAAANSKKRTLKRTIVNILGKVRSFILFGFYVKIII